MDWTSRVATAAKCDDAVVAAAVVVRINTVITTIDGTISEPLSDGDQPKTEVRPVRQAVFR